MTDTMNRRILVADDEAAILAEYRRIFSGGEGASVDLAASLEAELFGKQATRAEPGFELVTCRQGDAAVEAVRAALAEGRPFPVAYLDVRMPPGPNGVDTARAIRALDPSVHIAIITGYSDIPPAQIAAQVLPADRLFYFEKPFRGIELRQLAVALTAKWHMERALESARDDLERQVRERTKALAEAKEVAEAANEAKTSFLTNMSHELRTPLNAVIGFSDLMLAEPLGPIGHPRYREYVGDISASGKHLLNLINSILDLAQADRGTLSLTVRPFDLADAIRSALRLVHPQAVQADVRLREIGADTVGEVAADRTKICQILINLLSNAVKFTPPGGEVRLEAFRSEADEVVIRVADSGVGIRPEDVPRALQPFVQVGDASGRTGGTGLGLPLSVALVEMHGGSLALESAVGVGTTVTITFPGDRLRVRETEEPLPRQASAG